MPFASSVAGAQGVVNLSWRPDAISMFVKGTSTSDGDDDNGEELKPSRKSTDPPSSDRTWNAQFVHKPLRHDRQLQADCDHLWTWIAPFRNR
jgi:hypothetical protein